jgi:hypothetical protein
MSSVILPKTDDEIKEERKEWREEDKVKKLKIIAEQVRLAANGSNSSITTEIQTGALLRSMLVLENQIERVRGDIVTLASMIILLLIAITINLYFY